jgi:hypothetical protein
MPPFAVVNHVGGGERKELPVLVTFVSDVDGTTFERVRSMFEAWGRVLSWGGFPPVPGWPSSMGAVSAVSGHLAEEVVATIESFCGSEEAWDALERGLRWAHEAAPIASVEIG